MRLWIAGVLLAACLARAGDITSTAPSTEPTSGPATSPATAPVEPRVEVKGYLQPVDALEVRVRPKVYGGELTVLSVAPNGTSVKVGELLLEIDDKPLKRQLSAAQNELRVAQANADKAEADAKLAEQTNALSLRQQQDALKQAKGDLKWWESVDGPQMLLNADLAVKRSQASVDDQQDELNELKKMYKSEELTNATADIVVKRAVRNLGISGKELTMTQQQADKLKTFTYPFSRQKVADNVLSAQYALEQLRIAQKQAKVLSDAGLVSAHAALDDATRKVADLQADAQQLSVRAAAEGVVGYGPFVHGVFEGDPKALRAGEKVAPQQVLMTVYVPGKLSALAELPEKKFAALREGDAATLTAEAYPDVKMRGVCRLGPRTPTGGGGGPSYTVTFNLEQLDARLVPGSVVSIQMDSAPATRPATTTAATQPNP